MGAAVTPSIHQPSRTDAEVEVDRLWHMATFATDPAIATVYWRRFNEALKAPDSDGLAAAGASLPVIGG